MKLYKSITTITILKLQGPQVLARGQNQVKDSDTRQVPRIWSQATFIELTQPFRHFFGQFAQSGKN